MTTGVESRPPPVHESTPVQWIKRNLIRTWFDTLMTIVFGAIAVVTVVALVRFLLGADYTILRVNLTNFMVGRFPRDIIWRPAVALILAAVLMGFLGGAAAASARAAAAQSGAVFRPTTLVEVLRRQWPVLAAIGLILSLTQTITPTLVTGAALVGGWVTYLAARRVPAGVRRWSWLIGALLLGATYLVLAGFGGVRWSDWGGFHLNLFLTIAGVILAFPFGLLLALGRRSSLRAVRWMSVTYIELIRGVPLITLLLLGVFAIGFFLPDALRPAQTARVLIAIVLFESAYIAEVVRGGLQAIGVGQTEASQALGMPAWKTMRRIVLPQALRVTIPAMVGQFISLYKDTTLASLVGEFDVLNVSGAANVQTDFIAQGLDAITLPFVGLLFWVGSYAMSREARRLERRLGIGRR